MRDRTSGRFVLLLQMVEATSYILSCYAHLAMSRIAILRCATAWILLRLTATADRFDGGPRGTPTHFVHFGWNSMLGRPNLALFPNSCDSLCFRRPCSSTPAIAVCSRTMSCAL